MCRHSDSGEEGGDGEHGEDRHREGQDPEEPDRVLEKGEDRVLGSHRK
jgi:hypothetical protein